MIKWTNITDQTQYELLRYDFLLNIEENGTPKLLPYNDDPNSKSSGNITIGVGFNLEGKPGSDPSFL